MAACLAVLSLHDLVVQACVRAEARNLARGCRDAADYWIEQSIAAEEAAKSKAPAPKPALPETFGEEATTLKQDIRVRHSLRFRPPKFSI
jgi:hypothetical protein